jgi:hypothetical protein
MDPVLAFDLTTDQFPLRAGSKDVVVTIIATNNTSKPIALEGFYISFPVGISASHLTSNGARIVAITPEGLDAPRKNEAEGQVKFTYDVTFTFKPKQALAFVFNNIDVNALPGTSEIKVTEIHSASDIRPMKLGITKFPKGWGKVTFTVEKPVISFGGEAAMNWEGPEGATYTIEYYSHKDRKIVKVPAMSEPPLSNKGRYPSSPGKLNLNKTTSFVLNVELVADGEAYRAQEQKTITVEDPPVPEIKSFRSSKTLIAAEGPEQITFEWAVKDAAVVELSGDNMKTRIVTGETSFKVTLDKSGVYELKAIAEDHTYVTAAIEIQTYLDFLTYNKFRLFNAEGYVYHQNIDSLKWRTLEEKVSFLKSGEGRYSYVKTQYTKSMQARKIESTSENRAADFNWKVSKGKIEITMKGGSKDPVRLLIVDNALSYEATSWKDFTRIFTSFSTQRLEKTNAATSFDMDPDDIDADYRLQNDREKSQQHD